MDDLHNSYPIDMHYIEGRYIKEEPEEIDAKENIPLCYENNSFFIKEEDEVDIKHEIVEDLSCEPIPEEVEKVNQILDTNKKAKNKRVYSGKKTFVCDVCGKIFKTKTTIRDHLKVHTQEKPFVCDVCFKAFSWRNNRDIHKRIHTREKPYKCDICDRNFAWQSSLEVHKQTHAKNSYECEVCGRNIEGKNNLWKHIRSTHFKERPHTCEVCNISFPWKFKLKIHMRTHTKEKPFGCNECDKSFPIKAALIRHFKVHTKERPYACDLCEKAYPQLDHLKAHKKRAHTKSLIV